MNYNLYINLISYLTLLVIFQARVHFACYTPCGCTRVPHCRNTTTWSGETYKHPRWKKRLYSSDKNVKKVGTFLCAQTSSRCLVLDVGEDRLVLTARPSLYHLDIFHPFLINQESSFAQYNSSIQVQNARLCRKNSM